MLPDRVSSPGPLTYESGALPIALRGPAVGQVTCAIEYTSRHNAVACDLSNRLNRPKMFSRHIPADTRRLNV